MARAGGGDVTWQLLRKFRLAAHLPALSEGVCGLPPMQPLTVAARRLAEHACRGRRSGAVAGRRLSAAPHLPRQARVGSRRLQRLFAEKKKLDQAQFVGILEEEFNRRIARGLSVGRAVLEIQVNMPLDGMLAAEYGNE